jgi:hypothetical protein
VFHLGTRAFLARKISMKFCNRSFKVTLSGTVPATTPWFLSPLLLPLEDLISYKDLDIMHRLSRWRSWAGAITQVYNQVDHLVPKWVYLYNFLTNYYFHLSVSSAGYLISLETFRSKIVELCFFQSGSDDWERWCCNWDSYSLKPNTVLSSEACIFWTIGIHVC